MHKNYPLFIRLFLSFALFIGLTLSCNANEHGELISQASSGDVDAQFDLAEYYLESEGGNKSIEQAFEWFQKSAIGPENIEKHPFYVVENSGKTEAQFQLGKMYAEGIGVESDIELAERWFIQSALSDNTDNKYNLAEMYLNGNLLEEDKEQAFLWHIQAAMDGSRDSQYAVANMLHHGQGTEQNEELALKWYLSAAEQGDTDAQYELGYFYQQGIAVEVDNEKALDWYTQALNAGNEGAQIKIEELKSKNADISPNELMLLANQGDVEAQYLLGLMYGQGKNINKDLVKAYKWLSLSAKKGHLKALKYRGTILSLLTTRELIKANKQVNSFQAK